MNRILIIGGSGFLGSTLYKELQSYFDVYATYHTQEGTYGDNQVYFPFKGETDQIGSLLDQLRPRVIISCFKAESLARVKTHERLSNYVSGHPDRRLLYLSSYKVFDGRLDYPAYENDYPYAESEEGKDHLAVERVLRLLPGDRYGILRLPPVYGLNSPRMIHLQQAIRYQATIEVFPKLVVNLTTADKVAQQVHYLINKGIYGIQHLGSTDLVHHEDLISELVDRLDIGQPRLKRVFSRNEDHFLAVLPRHHTLPRPYRITVQEVIQSSALSEEIVSGRKG